MEHHTVINKKLKKQRKSILIESCLVSTKDKENKTIYPTKYVNEVVELV